MLVLMKHSTESVVSSYAKAGDLIRNHQWHGQRLERAGVRDALMRPVPVVEKLELPHGVQKVRLAAEAELRRATPTAALNREQVQAVIEQCADLAKGLRDAEPADMAGAYRKLGVRLTYHPGRNLVQATASPRPANIGKWLVSEGGLELPPDGPHRGTSAVTETLPDQARS